jgi:hypothetical protein
MYTAVAAGLLTKSETSTKSITNTQCRVDQCSKRHDDYSQSETSALTSSGRSSDGVVSVTSSRCCLLKDLFNRKHRGRGAGC